MLSNSSMSLQARAAASLPKMADTPRERDYIGLSGASPRGGEPRVSAPPGGVPDLGLHLGPPQAFHSSLDPRSSSAGDSEAISGDRQTVSVCTGEPEMARDAARLSGAVAGAKRVFAEVGCSQSGEESPSVAEILPAGKVLSPSVNDSEIKHLRSRLTPPAYPWGMMNHILETNPMDLDQSRACEASQGMQAVDFYANAPTPSSPVVGWPPVQSYRNKALATHPQPKPNETQALTSAVTSRVTPLQGTLVDSFFVKVYMDGVAIGRKLDLNRSNSYERLSSLLEEMFRHFISDKRRAQKSNTGNIALVKDNKEQSFTHGSEYVLTYEDKDGDLMLVGDVPWSMFVRTVKRLRIMKGSDAIGLAPKALEKANTKAEY